MKARLIVAAAATFLTAAAASAERYALTKLDLAGKAMVAVNLDTIRTINGNPRAWVFTGMTIKSQKGPVFVQSLTEFECATGRSRTLTNKMYDEHNSFLQDIGSKEWDYVVPDTTAYDTLQVGCATDKASKLEILNETTDTLFRTFVFGIDHPELDK